MRSKFVLTGLMALALLGFSTGAQAEVNINVGISPPPLVIHGPPELVVIPGTYVYFLPDVQVDVFFYHGYWYRPYGGRWYRSVSYEGPWGYITSAYVPRVFFRLPPRFRSMEVYRRIPHRELHRNWRTWERQKYWDRVARERHELRRERERHEGIAPRFDEHGRPFDKGRERHDFDRGRERHDFGRERERVR